MAVRGLSSSRFTPPQREDVRQRLYALHRRRWADGVATYLAGGRLVLRVAPAFVPAKFGDPFDEVAP
jgi:hypothetical protein